MKPILPLRRRLPSPTVVAVVVGTALTTGFTACNTLFDIVPAEPTGSGGKGTGGMPATGGAGSTASGASTSSASSTASNGSTNGASSTSSSSGTGAASSTTSSGATSSATSSGTGGGDAGAVSRDGLVLLLHLDEASWPGAGAVTDSSSYRNNGTVMGTVTSTTQGHFGGAASFGGQGFINIPDAPSLDASGALTCTAWIYPTMPMPNGGGIVTKRISVSQQVGYTMFLYQLVSSNPITADLQGTRYYSSTNLDTYKWYHIAVVFDGSQAPSDRVRIYINGSLDSKQMAINTTLDPSDASVQVGNLPGGGQGFVGLIDEVAVWTRALTQIDITNLYTASGAL
jgi:hypothetical protein